MHFIVGSSNRSWSKDSNQILKMFSFFHTWIHVQEDKDVNNLCVRIDPYDPVHARTQEMDDLLRLSSRSESCIIAINALMRMNIHLSCQHILAVWTNLIMNFGFQIDV